MNGVDVNKLTQWLGIITVAITTVITFSNLFHTVEDHEVRIKKIEKTEEQLTQLQKSLDYATWRIDSLSKDFDKMTAVKGAKR